MLHTNISGTADLSAWLCSRIVPEVDLRCGGGGMGKLIVAMGTMGKLIMAMATTETLIMAMATIGEVDPLYFT